MCLHQRLKTAVAELQRSLQRQSSQVAARTWGKGGEGEWGMTADGYGVSLWGDENVLNLAVVIAVQLCENTENH